MGQRGKGKGDGVQRKRKRAENERRFFWRQERKICRVYSVEDFYVQS